MGKTREKKTALSAVSIANARWCSDVEYARVLESNGSCRDGGRKFLGIMVL